MSLFSVCGASGRWICPSISCDTCLHLSTPHCTIVVQPPAEPRLLLSCQEAILCLWLHQWYLVRLWHNLRLNLAFNFLVRNHTGSSGSNNGSSMAARRELKFSFCLTLFAYLFISSLHAPGIDDARLSLGHCGWHCATDESSHEQLPMGCSQFPLGWYDMPAELCTGLRFSSRGV